MKVCLKTVKAELRSEGKPFSNDVRLGVIIEIPAAAIISDDLAKKADFFSIGANDLTQYTLAADRQNEALGRSCDPHHKAVLRLIRRQVAENAHRQSVKVGICGELGADLTMTETFLAMGIDELSVTPLRCWKFAVSFAAAVSVGKRRCGRIEKRARACRWFTAKNHSNQEQRGKLPGSAWQSAGQLAFLFSLRHR